MKNNINSLLSLIIGLFLSILTLLKFNEYVSIICLLMGQAFAIYFEINKITNNTNSINESIKDYFHVTKIGKPIFAWNYIIDRLPEVKSVKNTSFNFKDEYEQTNKHLYNENSFKKSIKTIIDSINNGLLWEDIGDSSAIQRFREINSKITKRNKIQFDYRIIEQKEPQIGFIILEYKDGTIEVLFNWDYRDIPNEPDILLTRNKEICEMFSAHFKSLLRVGVKDYDDDNNATKSISKK